MDVIKLLLALVFYSFNFSRGSKKTHHDHVHNSNNTPVAITTTKHVKGKPNKENHWHERTTWRRSILAIMTFQLVVWPKFFPILHFEIISTLYVRAFHFRHKRRSKSTECQAKTTLSKKFQSYKWVSCFLMMFMLNNAHSSNIGQFSQISSENISHMNVKFQLLMIAFVKVNDSFGIHLEYSLSRWRNSKFMRWESTMNSWLKPTAPAEYVCTCNEIKISEHKWSKRE